MDMKTYLEAKDAFLTYLMAEKNYSPLTIAEYRIDLNIFSKYLQENYQYPESFPVTMITKYEVANFLADMILQKKNQAATRNRRLYALRSFFNYLEEEEIIEKNPATKIHASKEPLREPIYLKPGEIHSFLGAVDSTSRYRVRDKCIIKLLLYCGLRVSELTNLDMDTIHLEDKTLSFIGKGNRERRLPIHRELEPVLESWLLKRNTFKKKGPDAMRALFLSNRGLRMTPRNIQYMIKRYAKKAGIRNAQKITPHKLRHTFATIIYQQTGDIRLVQDLLGHSSISTTQIYSHTDLKQREMAIGEIPDF